MNHQHLLWQQLVKSRQDADRLTASIHESLWLEQMYIPGATRISGFIGIKSFFESKWHRQMIGEQIDKPESGIVPGIDVIGPGITEADDQTDICSERRHEQTRLLIFGGLATFRLPGSAFDCFTFFTFFDLFAFGRFRRLLFDHFFTGLDHR